MVEPCTIKELEASCRILRAEAIAVGRQLEEAKVNGVKMRVLRGFEIVHQMAWSRYYSVDNRLHEALHERAS